MNRRQIKGGRDLYQAAMILHHSIDTEDLRSAKKLAHRSMQLGFERAKWLYASTTDRALVLAQKPQKFGTQYIRGRESTGWRLAEYDARTTDNERALYGIPSLKKLKISLRRLNDKRRTA